MGENDSPLCTRSIRMPDRDDRVHRPSLRLEPAGARAAEAAGSRWRLRLAELLDCPIYRRPGSNRSAYDRYLRFSFRLGRKCRIAARRGCPQVAEPRTRVRRRCGHERYGISGNTSELARPRSQGSPASGNDCGAVSLPAFARCFRQGLRRELQRPVIAFFGLRVLSSGNGTESGGASGRNIVHEALHLQLTLVECVESLVIDIPAKRLSSRRGRMNGGAHAASCMRYTYSAIFDASGNALPRTCRSPHPSHEHGLR